MKKMKSMKKRMFSAFLAMTMIIGLVPTVVFAAGESVSITATYNDVSGLETVTATDESTILLTVTVNKEEQTGDTLEIVIPRGVELLSAPGVDSVDSSTASITLKETFDTKYTGYFDETPTNAITWVANETLEGSNDTTKIGNTSGTLTYQLGDTNSLDFSIQVRLNSYFVPLIEDADGGVDGNTVLGDVTATLTPSGASAIEDAVTIQAATQVDDLRFNYFSVREFASDSLDKDTDITKTNLMEGNVQSVKLSAAIGINTPLAAFETSQLGVYPYFYLTVPAGSTVVANGSYAKDATAVEEDIDDDETTDTWRFYINNPQIGVTQSTDQINMGNFATVTLPGTIKAEENYAFTISDLVFPMRNTYDATTETFIVKEYFSDDKQTASIDVIAFDETYALGILGNVAFKSKSNTYYYESEGDTYADYLKNLEDLNGEQVLMTFRRTFAGVTDAATDDSSISITPVQMVLEASKIDHDKDPSTASVYLDYVNNVNFLVPFLGVDAPRQSSELLALSITTEEYGTKSEDVIGKTYTEKTYTFTQDEIDAFMADVTSDGTNIGNYNFGNGLAIRTSGIVEYHWASSAYVPMLKIQAPEGESIVKIVAEFSGDTNSFMSDSTGYDYKVMGYPKDPDITGIQSVYTYSVYQDTDSSVYAADGAYDEDEAAPAYDKSIVTATSGFYWTSPATFDLTASVKSTSDVTYMYNNAEANFAAEAATTGKGLTGYQDLGSIYVSNGTSAFPRSAITASATIGDTGDVVKEIYFPYISDAYATPTVTALSYTLVDDDPAVTYDGLGEYSISSDGTYGIITAPEGESFASFSVTLDSWTNQSTKSIFELRGYLKDSNELKTGDGDDTYTLTVTTESGTSDTAVDSTFVSNTSSYAAMRVLNTTSVEFDSTVGPMPTTVLLPGVESRLEFQLFGGLFQSSCASTWHDIEFTVVLPSSITVNDITVGDFHLEHATSATNVVQIDTGETVSEVELIDDPVATLNAEACKLYYGTGTAVTEAKVYKYKLSDEDAILYWTRYADGDWDTRTNFTVTMDLTTDIEATAAVIPWSKVLILGTGDDTISAFDVAVAQKGFVSMEGQQIANYSGDLSAVTTGESNNVVVGSDSTYLYIDSDPVVMVQDAYVTMDGDETNYHYYEDDEATFTSGGEGKLHFSVIDTVADDNANASTDVSYVLFPLPTVKSATNALQGVAEFAVTPGTLVVTLPDNTGESYVAKYVTLEETDVSLLTAASIIELYNAETAGDYSNTNGHNALVLAITNQKQFSTIEVSLGFTVPEYNTESAEYVKLSGMTSYISSGTSRARYYGGYAPENTDSGENYVYFAYHYPEWDITYMGVKDNVTTDNATVEITMGDATTIVDDGDTLIMPGNPTSAFDGYTLATGTVWYTDEALTKEYSATAITADTTLYAKYDENQYTVAFAYDYTGAPAAPTSVKAYYTGTIALPTADTRIGYTFDGWYYGDIEVTTSTQYQALDSDGDGNGDGDGVTGVTLTAKYDATDYTVVYHLNYTDATDTPASTVFEWDDTLNTLATPTRDGYTLAGWAKTDNATAETVIATAATYGSVFTDATDTEVEVYAVWTAKEYTVAFDLNDDTDTSTPDSIDSITDMTWSGTFSGLVTPVRAGYTFDGWYYDSGSISNHVIDGDTYSEDIGVDDNTNPVTLTAKWTEKTDYTLTFNDQIDNTADDTDTMAWTGTVTLPTAPTQTGYTFGGWYTDADCTGDEFTSGTFSSITGNDENATLFAKWTENTYTIVFSISSDYISTSYSNMENVTWTQVLSFVDRTPADTNYYYFVHWDYEDASGICHPVETGDSIESALSEYLSDTDLADKEITLHAHYVVKKITFNYNVPFVVDTKEWSNTFNEWHSVVIDADNTILLDSLSVDGYTFDGWYAVEGLTGDAVSSTDTPATYYDTDTANYADGATNNLYASYIENTYTITYDLVYQEVTNDDKVTYTWNNGASGFDFPEDPTRDGYTFTGWYRTNTGGTLSNKVTEGTAYSDTYGTAFDSTLGDDGKAEGTVYAGWTAKTYTVTYRRNYADAPADGKIAEVTLGWDETLTAPTAPERTGYTFLGWDKSSTATTATYGTTFSNQTYSGMAGSENEDESGFTLYGVWKVNTYTVTYNVGASTDYVVDTDGDGVGVANTIDVAYNATFTLTTLKPTIAGQTFDAWYTVLNPLSAAVTSKESTYSELFGATDMTLYANYTDNDYEITFTNLVGGDVTDEGVWGDTVVVPATTKDGYSFYSWYNGEEKVTIASDATFADLLKADSVTSMTLTAWWKENTPAASVDYSNEVLTGLDAGESYTITVVGTTDTYTITADEDGYISLATEDYDLFGKTLHLVKDVDGDYTVHSDYQIITLVARPLDPYSSLSTNTASTAYDGAQIFTLKCDTANTNIHYDIYEFDGYSLVDGGTYNTESAYAMKETSSLEIYAVITDGTEGAGLKSATVNYMYYIAENLSVDTGDFDTSAAIISTVDDSAYATLVTSATALDFGLIKIDDIVTDAEEEILLGAIPSGYTEEVEFHLHATIDDEIIYSTVNLATEVTVDIVLDEYDSSKTYQVLHMKHDGDHVDDVEIFSEENGNLIVFPETKTLRITGLTSLSPFMVVSKSTSSSNFKLKSDTVSAALETFEHIAYMQGYSDGTFAPNADITRAQAVVMLSRLLTEQMDMSKTYTSNFSDVTADLWYANAVGYMANLGIITGYTDGTFRGDNPISRAEFAVIACRFDQLELSGTNPFSDVDDDYWAVDYISAASEEGWVLGYSDGTFRPSQNITRAQAVTMVNRVLARSCDVSFVEDHLDDVITFTDVDEDYWAYDQILEATNSHEYTDDDGEENWTSIG